MPIIFSGKKVLVLEKHYNTGGGTHSWEANGYEWDTGVHYVGHTIKGLFFHQPFLVYLTI